MIEKPDLSRLSLANLTVGRIPQQELARAAAAAGFGKIGVLLMTATVQPLQHELLGRPEVIRELKATLRDTGMRVFDIEAFVLSPETDLERFRPALELGAELGATHISSIGTEFRPGATYLTTAERIDLFGRLCDEAVQFGLSVGVEFMLYRDIRTFKDALQLIEAAGRVNAGLILDVLHFIRAGSKPSELALVPPSRIAYAQLCDGMHTQIATEALAQEARTSRRHLGTGQFPLQEILDVLPEDLQLVVETPVATEASWTAHERAKSAGMHALDFLRKCST